MKRINLFDIFWLTYNRQKRDNYIYCSACFFKNFKTEEEQADAILYLIFLIDNIPVFKNDFGLYTPKMSNYFKKNYWKNEIYIKLFDEYKHKLKKEDDEKNDDFLKNIKEFNLL